MVFQVAKLVLVCLPRLQILLHLLEVVQMFDFFFVVSVFKGHVAIRVDFEIVGSVKEDELFRKLARRYGIVPSNHLLHAVSGELLPVQIHVLCQGSPSEESFSLEPFYVFL